MGCGRNRAARCYFSLPSAVFALAFVLLGWIASHSVAYALVGLLPHGHDHHEQHIHGYLEALKLAGGCGLVLAFALALRMFFNHGSFGEWLHEGGVAGTRKQIALSPVLPAAVFVVIEYVERFAAGTGTTPSAQLLVVGVFVQLAVGAAVPGSGAHGVPGGREGYRVCRTEEASSNGSTQYRPRSRERRLRALVVSAGRPESRQGTAVPVVFS